MERGYRYEVLPMEARKYWYINDLAANLRPQDMNEFHQLGITNPYKEIEDSLKSSDEAYVAVNGKGKVIVMYGVIRREPGGQIWCLGTRLFNEYKKSFVCGCMAVLKRWLGIYGNLWNFVSRDNELSIRWLKTYGAKFDKGYMKDGNEFWKFTIGGDI